MWETVSHSMTFNPEKDDGKYWHFLSIKTMAFAQVIKATTPIACLCCVFQSFSSLKNKNFCLVQFSLWGMLVISPCCFVSFGDAYTLKIPEK